VTGVAYEGKFHAISDVDELETFAARAYREGKPLLLEIELWARANPLNRKDELRHQSTAFFKLKPERAMADISSPELRAVLGRGVSRPPFEITRRLASFNDG
jgi:hypothetical protein